MQQTILNYSFEGVPTIKRFVGDHSFVRGLMGPFGSGKSTGCIADLIMRGQRQRRGPDGIRHTRWAIIRNTVPELRDTTMRTVFQWLPIHQFGKYTENKHTYSIKAFEGCDIEFNFLALDRPEDIGKLLSLELTGGWINEGREVPWAIFEALMGRVGRWPATKDHGCSWSGILSDTNPPDSDSRWFQFFEDKVGRDGKKLPKMATETQTYSALLRQPSGRSPEAENLANLPGGRDYYVRLAIGKSQEWIKVYIDGEYGYVMDGRPVYPEYVDTVHCQAVDPVPGVTIIRSYDWGLTPACAFSQILPDGRWLTFDEKLADNMGADQFTDEVLEHCARSFRGHVEFEDWGDPAGEQRVQTDTKTCFEICEGKGIKIQASEQSPALRQEAVKLVLRQTVDQFQPRFILHPRCKALRKGFMGGYHYRRLQVPGADRFTDKPVKNDLSHIHDGLQYGVVKYFAPVLRGAPAADDYPDIQDAAVDASRSEVTGY